MRTTITLNLEDDLLARASTLTGITNRTVLIRERLKAIVARESARSLALLGSMPDFELSLRRRPEPQNGSETETGPAKRSADDTDQSKT